MTLSQGCGMGNKEIGFLKSPRGSHKALAWVTSHLGSCHLRPHPSRVWFQRATPPHLPLSREGRKLLGEEAAVEARERNRVRVPGRTHRALKARGVPETPNPPTFSCHRMRNRCIPKSLGGAQRRSEGLTLLNPWPGLFIT